MLNFNPDTTYIFSDPHFCHKNIINYCSRPFEFSTDGVNKMNETILNNIISTVPDGSSLICLGDWTMMYSKANQKYIESVFLILKEHKYILYSLLGNHDINFDKGNLYNLNPTKYFLDNGFQECWSGPTIVNNFFILSHEPIQLEANSIYVNLHGHIHNTAICDLTQYPIKPNAYNHFYNCCMDIHDFKPILFREIFNYFNSFNS